MRELSDDDPRHNPATAALVDDIADHINSRHTRLNAFRRRYRWPALLLLFGVVVALYAILGARDGGATKFLIAWSAALGRLTGFLMGRSDRRTVIVVPQRRAEARGWGRQTRRDVIVGLPSVVLGAVLGVLGSKLLGE